MRLARAVAVNKQGSVPARRVLTARGTSLHDLQSDTPSLPARQAPEFRSPRQLQPAEPNQPPTRAHRRCGQHLCCRAARAREPSSGECRERPARSPGRPGRGVHAPPRRRRAAPPPSAPPCALGLPEHRRLAQLAQPDLVPGSRDHVRGTRRGHSHCGGVGKRTPLLPWSFSL